MADNIQTFKAICRGGLNTTGDVLSQGEETPGSATKLLNYEPDLQGGYRRISGYADYDSNYGTVAGSGNIIGLWILEGVPYAVRRNLKDNTASFHKYVLIDSSYSLLTLW